MKTSNDSTDIASAGARLARDFRVLTNDARKLLLATRETATEGVAAMRQRLEEDISEARDAVTAAEDSALAMGRAALEQGSLAARGAVSYARAHPWQTAAAVVAVAVTLKLLLSSKAEPEAAQPETTH